MRKITKEDKVRGIAFLAANNIPDKFLLLERRDNLKRYISWGARFDDHEHLLRWYPDDFVPIPGSCVIRMVTPLLNVLDAGFMQFDLEKKTLLLHGACAQYERRVERKVSARFMRKDFPGYKVITTD